MTDTFIVTITIPRLDTGMATILTPAGRLECRPINRQTIASTTDWRTYVELLLIQMYPVRKASMHGSNRIFQSNAQTMGLRGMDSFVEVYEVDFEKLWGPREDEVKS